MFSDDTDYFDSYSGAEVHRMMLGDRVRTEAYRDAIEAVVKPGMVVLDVGAGTGILSFFAARAGAAKVYAVDNSDILDTTRELAQANGFGDIIECIDGCAEDIQLPQKVDIIVSEWMGLYALTEAMFESVVAATHKHLRLDGQVIPAALSLHLVPIRDDKLYHEHGLGFWQNDMYGFDYSAMVGHEICDLETNTVDGSHAKALGRGAVVALFDAYTTPAESYWFKTEFTLEVDCDGPCHGFLGHFDARLSEEVMLSTSHELPLTHWRQSWFPLQERELRCGDRLEIKFRAQRDQVVDSRKPVYFLEGQVLRAEVQYSHFLRSHTYIHIVHVA